MRPTKNAILSFLICLLAINLYACKGEVDVNVNGLDTVADAITNAKDKTGDGTDELEGDVANYEGSYDGSNENDEETAGGVQILAPEGYDPNASVAHYGTFKLGTNSGNYYSSYSERCDAEYNFPNIIRGWNHIQDDYIDFESNEEELLWIAKVTTEDETFDFTIRFLDVFSKPTVKLSCTCKLIEGYGKKKEYYKDELHCDCNGSDKCSLYYTEK